MVDVLELLCVCQSSLVPISTKNANVHRYNDAADKVAPRLMPTQDQKDMVKIAATIAIGMNMIVIIKRIIIIIVIFIMRTVMTLHVITTMTIIRPAVATPHAAFRVSIPTSILTIQS